jgi:hypothetical protein
MAEYTIADIQERLADADRAYKQANDNTVNLRQTFLRAQAQTMVSSGRLSEAAAIKSLEHHKAMKRANQQLRNLMSRSNQGSSGFAMIKVPVEPPSATPIEAQEPLAQQPPPIKYRVVLDSQEIELALLVHNAKYYGQAKEFPFEHAPLYLRLLQTGPGRQLRLCLRFTLTLHHKNSD